MSVSGSHRTDWKSTASNAAQFDPSAIPGELIARRQWVLWRSEIRDGKRTKVPYQPNGRRASATEPSTWSSYHEVLARHHEQKDRYTGIGFVFTAADPYAGIDLDDSIDDHGNPKPWAQPIIQKFRGTYMEVSPSGKGIKIWVKAKLPCRGKKSPCHDGAIEVYDQRRYFTVTGRVFGGAPPEVALRQAAVDWLYQSIGTRKKKETARTHHSEQVTEGRRHDYLVTTAAQFRARGMDFCEILAALRAINQQRCAPPKPDHELEAIVDWVCQQPPGINGQHSGRVEKTDIVVMDSIPASLFDRDLDVPDEIVGGILRNGQLGVFAGQYGVGKTPLLCQLDVCLASGMPWLGRRVWKRPVIHLDFESPPAVWKRNAEAICSRLKAALPAIPEEIELHLEHDDPQAATAAELAVVLANDYGERLAFLRRLLSRKPDAVLIVDPLELLFLIDKNRSTEVLGLYQNLRRLLRDFPRAAIIAVYNLRKRDRNAKPPSLLFDPRLWLEEVSGCHEILTRADVRLGLDEHPLEPSIKILHGVRRGEHFNPILLRSAGGGLEGFETVELREHLELVFTGKQMAHWCVLPEVFSFSDAADRLIPRSSLSRLLRRALSVCLLEHHGEVFVKI